MSRFRTYGELDDPLVPEGDKGFLRVDMRRNPRLLEPGTVADALNKEFTQGVASTRRGIQTVKHGQELGVDFDLCFNPWTKLTEVLSANAASITGLTWRVYAGTTFQLRDLKTGEWHSIWLEEHPTASGKYTVTLDSNGMDADAWVYAPYDPPNANFRLIGSNKTFQLLAPATGLFHSLWVQRYHGAFMLMVDQDGMAAGETGSEPDERNWRNFEDTTFQLQDVDSASPAFHTIFVESLAGSQPTIGVNQQTSGEEGFCFDQEIGFGTTYGGGVFSDPYGNEVMLAAIGTGVYRVALHSRPTIIRLPAGERIEEEVRFLQCFDRVLMFRGPDKTPMVWNPALDFSQGLQEFEPIEQTAARGTDPDNTYGDGTVAIPNASEALFFKNRVWVVDGRDEIVVSDILDYTRYNEATSRFKINSGDNDSIVRLMEWDEQTIIVFKDQSVWALENVFGNLGSLSARRLSPEFGLRARDAVAKVGKDIWFLSDAGVFSVGQALDNKLQANIEPISAPIQPLMDRIRWERAGGAQMAYNRNKLFLAVPMDDQVYNNGVIVWDFLNGGWSGLWTSEYLSVKRFLRSEYHGEYRLHVLNGDEVPFDKAKGAILMMESGYEDRVWSDRFWIPDRIVTRGYSWQSLDRKDPVVLRMQAETWNPMFSTGLLTDGVDETVELDSDRTLSRILMWRWGEDSYEEDNSNDDHDRPYREDYSVEPGGSDGVFLLGGINLHRHQYSEWAYKVKLRGQFVQAEISNARGRCNVQTVDVSARTGKRGYAARV